MAEKSFDEWQVFDHGAIEKLAENLWFVDGSLPGMSLRRNMVVARLGDGRLVIHNAIALREPEMQALEAWGTPAFLVVPSRFHRLDAPRYKKRYPGLRVLAPSGARAKIEERVAVDESLDGMKLDESLRFEAIEGTKAVEGAMIVRSSDGTTVVVNDIVMNMDKKKDLLGWAFTTLLGSAPGPRMSRLVRYGLVKQPKALRAQLEAFAATPDLTRFIVAHEKVARGADAKAALLKVASTL